MLKQRILSGLIISAGLFLGLPLAFSQVDVSPVARDSIIEQQLLLEQEKLSGQQRTEAVLKDPPKVPEKKSKEKVVTPPVSREQKKAQEAARQEALKGQKKANQKEQADLKEQKRQKGLAAQEIARDRKARGKILMRQTQEAYNELLALYKQKDSQTFSGKAEILRALIESTLLPVDYRDTLGHRVDVLQEKMDRMEQTQRTLQERNGEKEELRAAQQKKKQERIEVRSVEAKEEKQRLKAEEKQKKMEAQAERREALLEKRKQEREASLQKEEQRSQARAHRLFDQRQEQLNKKKSATLSKNMSRVEATQENLSRSVEKRKKEVVREKESFGREFSTGIEELYRKGIELYKEGRYEQAHDTFADVDKMWPNYKLTKSYLGMTADVPEDQAHDPAVDQAFPKEEKSHGK